MDYKHYIRLNADGNIIKAFCDVFESPVDGDILISETDERHFNPDLFDDNGFPRYEWNGKEMIERTEYSEDEQAELAERQAKNELAQSDQALVRGIDDLVALLIDKEVITESELPADLADKIKARAELRKSLEITK